MGVIRQSPGAIGYGQLAFVTQNHIPYAALRNAAGAFVVPSLATVTAAVVAATRGVPFRGAPPTRQGLAANAYPIFGLTYIVLYRKQESATKARQLAAFLTWALHEGQRYAPPLVYAPLPPSLVSRNLQSIRTID